MKVIIKICVNPKGTKFGLQIRFSGSKTSLRTGFGAPDWLQNERGQSQVHHRGIQSDRHEPTGEPKVPNLLPICNPKPSKIEAKTWKKSTSTNETFFTMLLPWFKSLFYCFGGTFFWRQDYFKASKENFQKCYETLAMARKSRVGALEFYKQATENRQK